MKYIMLQVALGKEEFEVPIIFPNNIVHGEMARAMKEVIRRHFGVEPACVAAGDMSIKDAICYGKSDSLKLASRGLTDTIRIINNDYSSGFTK